ncbi:MAG: glycosyltransferase, partial [Pseudomonadota bacterium]
MTMDGENKAVTAWVLMTVYRGDDAEALDDALNSILVNQTRLPNGAIIVIDGPVDDAIEQVLKTHKVTAPCPITILPLEKNGGLSLALNQGLQAIPQEVTYVIRHDADDLSRP